MGVSIIHHFIHNTYRKEKIRKKKIKTVPGTAYPRGDRGSKTTFNTLGVEQNKVIYTDELQFGASIL